jgi:hypothetical protein
VIGPLYFCTIIHPKQMNEMVQTKEFMLLFRYEPSNDYQPTEAEMNEQHQLWGAFIGNLAIQEKLVSTHQLSLEGSQIFPGGTTKKGLHIADNQTVGGNMVIKAASLDEATELAKNCPILAVGGTVEVREITPM